MVNLIDLLPEPPPSRLLGNYAPTTLSATRHERIRTWGGDPMDPPPNTLVIIRV